MATTTSVENSGLLDYLLPEFEESYRIEVDVIAVGSGQAIELGKRGDVDILLTHAPALEKEFVEQGFGIDRRRLMYNRFVIVGPNDDPAGIRASNTVQEALVKIARSESVFASRGDQSGTHLKELALWDLIGSSPPAGDWYLSLGQGMGATLNLANQTEAYTLSDVGTFISQSENIPNLQILFDGYNSEQELQSELINVYSVIRINSEKHSGISADGAKLLEDWLMSVEVQGRIKSFGLDPHGRALFNPDSKEWREASNSGNGDGIDQLAEIETFNLGVFAANDLLSVVLMTARVSGLALLIACIVGIPLGVGLGLEEFPGKKMVRVLIYTGMGLPPVVVGLVIFLMLSRESSLGYLSWLFTPSAMVIAQAVLAFPLAAGLTTRAVEDISDKLILQVRAMGANPWQERWTIVREAKAGILAAVLAALGRIISEVGAAMLVGGNIAGKTRVLSTAIVLETRQGNFDLALSLGLILLGIALISNAFVLRLGGEWKI